MEMEHLDNYEQKAS